MEVNLNGHLIHNKIIMFANLFSVTLPTIKFLLVHFINTYLNTSDLSIIKNLFHRHNYLLCQNNSNFEKNCNIFIYQFKV